RGGAGRSRAAAARGLPLLPRRPRGPARAGRAAGRGARRVRARTRAGRRRPGAQAVDASAGTARRSLTYIGGMRRLLLRAIVAALCLTAGVAIVMLLAGTLDDTSTRILLTSTEVSFFGLLGVPAGMLLERNRLSWLARSSATLTAVSFLLTLTVTWRHDTPSALWRVWGVIGTLALAAAQAATVEARRRDSDSSGVRLLVSFSMLTGGALAALGVIGILGSVDDGGYIRTLGAIGVLDVLALGIV